METVPSAQTRHSKSSHFKWPNVYRRKHRGGQVGYVVDLGLVDGKRLRRAFKTKEEALTYAEQARVTKQNEGTAAFSLPLEVRTEAAKAHELLTPHGASLTEAVNYYLKHVIAYRTAPLIREVVQRMLDEVASNGRRERTIRDLRGRLRLFAADNGDRRLGDITLEELSEWVAEDEWSPRSRINYLTKISQLYNYARKHNWVDTNLAEKISRPTVEDKEPGILTVDQAGSLLSNAGTFGLLPYVALGLFAGLRSAELMRLDSSAVSLSGRSIIVGAQVAKKRSRRVVEISEALRAWLQTCSIKPGPVVDVTNFREQMDALKARAGIKAWPHNALRHSFASYHLAFYGDAMKTATILGHKDPGVIHNHYKALVQKSEAEKFWSLRPAGAGAQGGGQEQFGGP